MSDEDRAKVFIELAKQKHEGIWKRRQITWRTNFVLWAALLAIAAVLYREAGTLSLTSCILISVAVVIVFIAHAWHWACAYASDEKGFSLMHYYEDAATGCLKNPPVQVGDPPSIPEGAGAYLWGQHRKSKAISGVVAQVVVTAALMAIALIFVWSKTAKDSPVIDAKATVTQDRLSGENLHIVLQMLPSASQPSKP